MSGAEERADLLAAAISIAAVRGFADSTEEMITERAGVAREAFDRQFPSLAACFLTAWDALRDAYLDRLDAAYCAAADWRGGVRAASRETVGCLGEHPDESRLLAIEVMELGPPGRQRLDGLLDRLASIVDAGRRSSSRAARVPRSTAQGVVGGGHHRLVRELRASAPTPPGRLAAELASFAVVPYLGVEAGLEELSLAD